MFRGRPLNLLGQLDFAATRARIAKSFSKIVSSLPCDRVVSCHFFFPLYSFFFLFFEGKLTRRFRSRSADFLALKKQSNRARTSHQESSISRARLLFFSILFGTLLENVNVDGSENVFSVSDRLKSKRATVDTAYEKNFSKVLLTNIRTSSLPQKLPFSIFVRTIKRNRA